MRIRTFVRPLEGTEVVGKWYVISDEDEIEELKDIIRMVLKVSPKDGAYFSVDTPTGTTFVPRENIAFVSIQMDDNEA